MRSTLRERPFFDCERSTAADAETSIFNASGELRHHYKWADPQYLNPAMGQPILAGSVIDSAKNIACSADNLFPLVTKEQLAKMNFVYWSSTSTGDGDMYYTLPIIGGESEDQRRVISILKNHKDQNVAP
jgi:hypothetical protein